MTEKFQKLQICFNELFGDDYLSNCFIEVENNENEIVLAANQEGMLLLINELTTLCALNKVGNHYHLDEAGMASKCDKPMVIALVKENW